MEPPEGAPFEGRFEQAADGNRPMLYKAADTSTPDGTAMHAKAMKGKKGKKGKKDPGIMKLNHLLMMPGASEALSDRLAHM
jgi:hypothetical protein